MLGFLIYDVAKAKQVVSICNVAERKHISAEVVSDHYVGSESYWRHEQDVLCDVARIMKGRHRAAYADDYPGIAAMDLMHRKLYYPNVFITIAPAEERVRRHDAMFGAYATARDLGDITGPLCLHIDTLFKQLLLPRLTPFFEQIYEWALRVEFQGRGTLHVHLAMWA